MALNLFLFIKTTVSILIEAVATRPCGQNRAYLGKPSRAEPIKIATFIGGTRNATPIPMTFCVLVHSESTKMTSLSAARGSQVNTESHQISPSADHTLLFYF